MENKQSIKVWDIAIRVFHWALVGCYALAFISSENIPKLHVFFGYSVLFLVLFRILYGFVGTKYARFSDFLYHPAQITNYLRGLLTGKPKHYIGHNPAGGFMIFIMLKKVMISFSAMVTPKFVGLIFFPAANVFLLKTKFLGPVIFTTLSSPKLRHIAPVLE